MYLLYFSCPDIAIGQAQSKFFVPKAPQTVQPLMITLTQTEQQVYAAVMASDEIARLQVEIQAVANALRYDHDSTFVYTTIRLINHW